MMSDFASMDWDLQAVIRGSWSSTAADPTVTNQAPIGHYDHFNGQDDQELFFGSFPDIFDSVAATTTAADFFDELEGMYKPFYPPTSPRENVGHLSFHDQFQQQQQPSTTQVVVKQEEPQPRNNVNGPSSVISAVTSSSTAAQVAKYKRSRKNQQKRVVEQARAEGLSSSDKWAWRKYGQKPIKGSPYPRSYYRCSSSKGCPARKQVEQSLADPGMYIITYTADHNHTHPTRRNSLSGVARTKFNKSPPTTQQPIAIVKTEIQEEEEDCLRLPGQEVEMEMEVFMPDHIVFSDDVFPSLEDLHGCIMD